MKVPRQATKLNKPNRKSAGAESLARSQYCNTNQSNQTCSVRFSQTLCFKCNRPISKSDRSKVLTQLLSLIASSSGHSATSTVYVECLTAHLCFTFLPTKLAVAM